MLRWRYRKKQHFKYKKPNHYQEKIEILIHKTDSSGQSWHLAAILYTVYVTIAHI